MPALALVALGSNLPAVDGLDPLGNCRRALDTLAATPGLHLRAVSAWYRTRPVPVSDQPDYVNGVASFDTSLDPADLLAALHAIEDRVGRRRSVPNAARVLDLDLLAVDDRIIQWPTLILPHPRLQDRAFVLHPLCDVAPAWRHPILDRTATELRDALPPDGPESIQRVGGTTLPSHVSVIT